MAYIQWLVEEWRWQAASLFSFKCPWRNLSSFVLWPYKMLSHGLWSLRLHCLIESNDKQQQSVLICKYVCVCVCVCVYVGCWQREIKMIYCICLWVFVCVCLLCWGWMCDWKCVFLNMQLSCVFLHSLTAWRLDVCTCFDTVHHSQVKNFRVGTHYTERVVLLFVAIIITIWLRPGNFCGCGVLVWCCL